MWVTTVARGNTSLMYSRVEQNKIPTRPNYIYSILVYVDRINIIWSGYENITCAVWSYIYGIYTTLHTSSNLYTLQDSTMYYIIQSSAM